MKAFGIQFLGGFKRRQDMTLHHSQRSGDVKLLQIRRFNGVSEFDRVIAVDVGLTDFPLAVQHVAAQFFPHFVDVVGGLHQGQRK